MKLSLDSYAYSLARIRWDVFGTLTFRSVPSTKRAFGRAWAHMHQAAELVERPYSQLLIALRAELGEMGGRFHFHYLLGGTWGATQSCWRISLNIAGLECSGRVR